MTELYLEAVDKTAELAQELRFDGLLQLIDWNLFQVKLRLDTLIEGLLPAEVNDDQNPSRLVFELNFHQGLHRAIEERARVQRERTLLAP